MPYCKGRKFAGGRPHDLLVVFDVTVHFGRDRRDERFQRLRLSLDHQQHAAVRQVLHESDDRKARGDVPRGVTKPDALDASRKIDLPTFNVRIQGV